MSRTNNEIILEVCVDSVESARAAQAGGAQRIELCADLASGGTTPSAAMIYAVRNAVEIDLHVMIRPRAGDFTYSADEFDVMERDIFLAIKAGVEGVVFGILKEDRTVDRRRTAILVDLCLPLQVTFHRAFDITPDPFKALADLTGCGITHVLTSGGKRTAPEGAALIREMCVKNRLPIIAGSGIHCGNVRALIEETDVREVHVLSSVSRIVAYPNATLFDAMRWVVDAEMVREIVSLIH